MEVHALCVTGRTRRAGPPWEELCPRHRSAAPAPLPWLPPSVCTDPPPGTRARAWLPRRPLILPNILF